MRAHTPPWLGKLTVTGFHITVVRFLRKSRASGFFWALLGLNSCGTWFPGQGVLLGSLVYGMFVPFSLE